ncbi:MAG: UxaA family hydrolase, partial [Asticcacaulis sp.]
MIITEGYLRSDGRKGIRNVLTVIYLVECAHHVARRIVDKANDENVHLLGFSGCYPNDYSLRMMKSLTSHPNVGGAILVSLGCEGFDREGLAAAIEASGRPVETVVIQNVGGTRSGIDQGLEAVNRILARMQAEAVMSPMDISELTIGTIC